MPYLISGMNVIDFGAQNDFVLPSAPFVSVKYKDMFINYNCIDVNGKNDAYTFDLGTPIDWAYQADLVADAGTKEHVKNLYNAFENQHRLTRLGGLLYCENPKTGSWHEHGHHFFTLEFYLQLAKVCAYNILLLEEHPCNTSNDGWEIICLMQKTKHEFCTKDQFPKAMTE